MAIRLVFEPEKGWSGAAKSEPISIGETLILALAAQGYSNREIAEQLGIKYQSVKNSFHRLTKKLGAKNNVHALNLAIQAGLVKIEAIADELDGSLPVEEREKARLMAERESKKLAGMSKEEGQEYTDRGDREALQ